MNTIDFKLLAYPEIYALTSSSSPGIRISAQYPGAVDMVNYSTTHGSLLTWDIASGKTSNRGQNVVLPYNMPIYWIPVENNGLPKATDKISVKVRIFNQNKSLAEKQVEINYDGSMYYTVQSSPDIVIAENKQLQNSDINKEIMRKHISDFLNNGYSKYYIINSINCNFQSEIINEGNMEAIVFTTMNSNIPYQDPDTAPYMIQLKEKAQNETNPERKKILEYEYQIQKDEYGKPHDSNYIFKLTAKLTGYIIDEKSIKLYFDATAAANSKPTYFPAEDILPKE